MGNLMEASYLLHRTLLNRGLKRCTVANRGKNRRSVTKLAGGKKFLDDSNLLSPKRP